METTDVISEPRRLVRPKESRWLGGVAAGPRRVLRPQPHDLPDRIRRARPRRRHRRAALHRGVARDPGSGRRGLDRRTELKKHRDRPRRLIGLGILALAAIIALSESHVWPAPGNLWLVLVLALLAFAWWRLGPASSTRRRVAAISIVGVLAALLAAVAFAVRVPLFAGIGDRVTRPVDVANVHSKYELGIGGLTVDLSHVSLPKGQTFVKATVGIGTLRVIVPANASVDVRGRAQAGNVRLFDERNNGTHVSSHVLDRTGSGRVLVLDARTGIGGVQVQRG